MTIVLGVMKLFSYHNLDIYKLAKEIAIDTYKVTSSFPAFEQYGLVSQMNRAAISIPSNIAESSGRTGKKDKSQFISIAFASLMELSCQIEIAQELGYVDLQCCNKLINSCKDLSVRLSNYKKYLDNR